MEAFFVSSTTPSSSVLLSRYSVPITGGGVIGVRRSLRKSTYFISRPRPLQSTSSQTMAMASSPKVLFLIKNFPIKAASFDIFRLFEIFQVVEDGGGVDVFQKIKSHQVRREIIVNARLLVVYIYYLFPRVRVLCVNRCNWYFQFYIQEVVTRLPPIEEVKTTLNHSIQCMLSTFSKVLFYHRILQFCTPIVLVWFLFLVISLIAIAVFFHLQSHSGYPSGSLIDFATDKNGYPVLSVSSLAVHTKVILFV